MQEWQGDMMTLVGNVQALCITTNGYVKKDGTAVMGRGIAKQMAVTYPALPALLGEILRNCGNTVNALTIAGGTYLVSFPVKPDRAVATRTRDNVVAHMRDKFIPGDIVPGWACVASMELIERSAKQLSRLADRMNWLGIYLPRPGCGAGELEWSKVKPMLDRLLDSRFVACTFKEDM